MTENEIGTVIIAAAMKVHAAIGPGLRESAYETCLLYELEKQDLPVRQQVSIPIRYEDLMMDNGYRIDLLVGDRVVVELKALEMILPVHRAAAELFAARTVQAWLPIEFQCREDARRYRQTGQWPLRVCVHRGSSATTALKC